jgi:peptidoglycan/xylan/chitin deacetylase (PgdA/CDA1 family)
LARAAGAGLGLRYPFVLCYHGVSALVGRGDPAGLMLSLDLFMRHLQLIELEGYAVLGVGDLWRRMRAGDGARALGAITFDDAIASTARHAIPAMLARGMRPTVFVPTGLIGRHHPDLPGERILSASEIRELAEQGVEIGAHSVDHVWLPGLREPEILDQLTRSRALLEDLIGRSVRSMAYPYGGYDDRVAAAAAAAGYEVACGCSGPGPWRALSIPREPVYPSATPLRMRLKIAGLYGPVHVLVGDRGPLGRRRRHAPGDAAAARNALRVRHN